MLFLEAPSDFKPLYETVSCFCESRGEILLLRRHTSKREGNKWGIPAGKVETGEDNDQALLREIHEETGWSLDSNQLRYLRPVFVRYDDHDFVFHMYHTSLDTRDGLNLGGSEHSSSIWVKPKEAFSLDLVKDFPECIKIYIELTNQAG